MALMQRINSTLNVYNTVQKLRNMRGEEIHQLNRGERRIIQMLQKEELL